MKIINSKNAPKAVGPYSQGIMTNNLLFVSGQIPFNPKSMKAPEGIIKQTTQSLENVKAIVEEAGITLKDIVKVTIFVKNMDDFEEINKVYASFFNGHKPARALVEVARLPKDVLIEIEAIAVFK